MSHAYWKQLMEGKQTWNIRSVSEKAVLSHEAGEVFYFKFYNKTQFWLWGKGLFISSFSEIHKTHVERFYSWFPKLLLKHEGFSFYGLRKSDEGADNDVMFQFCLHNTVKMSIHSYSIKAP